MIIAISGKSGCGNSSVSRELAKKYSYRIVNYTFRDYADEHDLRFEEIHALAKKNKAIDAYIDKKQIELSQRGNCVVGSRLAIWKVPKPDLRVYLCAPSWVRAERIANREQLLSISSFIRTLIRDIRDRRRYRNYYKIDIDDYQFVDLVIDTSRHDIAEVVDIISKRIDDIL